MLSFPAVVLLCSVSQVEPFMAPGYGVPACGVWYAGGAASSAMPLGALGTGFVDLTSGATFGASTAENNWLKPEPVPAQCGLTMHIGDKSLDLFPGSKAPETMRFWGHYPAADVDFGSSFGGAVAYMRAFAPFVPHDYELSSLPVALFRFVVISHESRSIPVEIGLQWQAFGETGTKSQGNVEGVLGWQREVLEPGALWKPAPVFVFASNPNQLAARVRAFAPEDTALAAKDAPEGKAYSFGEVADFLLNPLGGFNWEAHRRQGGVYRGAPNIGQIFWNLKHGDQRAGYGMDGAYGLKGAALPTRTSDGALEVRLRVAKAGEDSVALVYTILNVSNKPVRDLRFGLAVNADIGGPEQSPDQQAEFDKDLGAAVFQNKRSGVLLALAGKPDACIVGTWPSAHAAMVNNEWVPIDSTPPAPAVQQLPNGIQIKGAAGSYAVGAAGGQGWTFKHVQDENNVIRTTAVRTFGPNETAEVTLALAWNFPYWTSSDGERLRHRYAAKYEDAGAVLAAALPRAGEIEQKIVAWQQQVYASQSTPALLKDAVINGLYVMARNSWWIDDSHFFQSESFTGCPITETFVCRFNGSFPLALFFPECEKATMRSVAGAQKDTGEIPFGFGSPAGSRSPYYHVQHPIVSPEFVLNTWRNYVLWQDAAYLDEMYPHCQAALRFAQTLDKDGDGVVNEDPGSDTGFPANQYYDIWPWWGTSAYTGSIWLAALRAGEEMAKKKHDTAYADELHKLFETASASFYRKLWTGAYYRLYNDPDKKRVSDTSLTNALCGQWFAYATGLGEIVPRQTILSVIDTVLRLNVGATKFGAVNGVRPDGSPDETFPDHSAVITIGEVWNFCAMAAFAGKTEEAMGLLNTSYGNILLQQRTPWNISWCLDRNTGAIKWGINYYSNPCVWTLFQALDPATYARLATFGMPSK